MNKEIANATIQFLARVQLSAGEIPAFMACKTALENWEDPAEEVREIPETHIDLESK